VRQLRDRGVTTPVIILSAKARRGPRAGARKACADDYLTKPFFISEFSREVQAYDSQGDENQRTDEAYLGGLSMDLLTRQVREEEKSSSYNLENFRCWISDAQCRASRHEDDDLEHIWDYSFDPQTNVVDVLGASFAKQGGQTFLKRCCTRGGVAMS